MPKPLDYDNITENVKKYQYAVRVSDVREAAEEEGRLGGFQQVKTIFEIDYIGNVNPQFLSYFEPVHVLRELNLFDHLSIHSRLLECIFYDGLNPLSCDADVVRMVDEHKNKNAIIIYVGKLPESDIIDKSIVVEVEVEDEMCYERNSEHEVDNDSEVDASNNGFVFALSLDEDTLSDKYDLFDVCEGGAQSTVKEGF
ncbi:hypothetical protein M9H77_35570 [Catharanthus roseus]|uniref:Uncharacterized protein n=1 Tax=Catharanthus roseus TaxID=4058 RepID=A0ACB9ZPN1_CATRO|nr:hypothetical protein M9H77_35570 [Catharanthus roseus]